MNTHNGADSASKLKVLSANVNGLNNTAKRGEFFTHIEKYHPNLICLCDTRLDPYMYDRLVTETNMYCEYSNADHAARGVCILIKKDVPIKIYGVTKDANGNKVKVKLQYDENDLILYNVYGPNNDSPEFWQTIFDEISNEVITNHMIVGDFNVTINPEMDNLNYANIRNNNSRIKLKELMQEYAFADVFRAIHGNKKQFTWNKIGGRQRARLDMCISSQSMIPYITNFETLAAYKSDHRPIMVTIDFTSFTRGKGYWKFNDSLLNDINYINLMKSTINTTCAKYYKSDTYGNFLQEASERETNLFKSKSPEELQTLEYNINPNMLYEMLLNDIRNDTITYSVQKRRQENEQERLLLENLLKFQNMKSAGVNVDNLENEIVNCENRYNEFIELKNEKRTFRKNVKDSTEGEKPTAYFCSQEKNQSAQKYISRLKVLRNGLESTIIDQDEIAEETRKYYMDLFSCKDNVDNVGKIEVFLEPGELHFSKLSDEEAELIEGKITEVELQEVLKKTTNDTSPGSTGFTYNFYKVFWRNLKLFVLNAANYSYETNLLPTSQRLGIITLLPKGDKPRDQLKNLRPVTIQNSGYKLISGTIASRINDVLPKLINEQQCGFVKGRFIGECIRTTMDVFRWANENKKTGLLLLIDFEKAFDSISFTYILKVLRFFGFKESLIKWVKTLLNNFSACINLAGNLTALFEVLRGARQGDPIASPLFVLAIEVLCIKLRNSEKVIGFRLLTFSVLLSLFADDCSIFLKYCPQNLRNVIEILNKFFWISGLKIQVEKTQCIVYGKIPPGDYVLCNEIKLKWEQDFVLLGINFNPSLENMESNLEKKLDEIESVMKSWKHRFLTPIGRCVIVKTLLLSKMSHIALVLPSLDKEIIKKIENKMYDFIWKGPDKVAREDAKKGELKGGLNMPDLLSNWQAFKLSWFRRLQTTKSSWGNIFDENMRAVFPNATRGDVFSKMGTQDLVDLGKKIPSKFWSEALMVLKSFTLQFLKKSPTSLFQCSIWNSHIFLRNNTVCKKFHYRSLFDKITYPLEIIKKDQGINMFLNDDEMSLKFGVYSTEEFVSLKVVISQSLQRLGISMENSHIVRPFQPITNLISNLSAKGCNIWTKVLKNKNLCNKKLIERERKWEVSLGNMQGNYFWDKCYKNIQDIFFDNKIKLFYYYIVRGTLRTNRTIHHHVDNISNLCTFCDQNVETIMHLFWECQVVRTFYEVIKEKMDEDYPIFRGTFTLKTFLFGIREEKMYSTQNFYALHLKRYVWIARCKKVLPEYYSFFNWFKSELRLKKACFSENPKLEYLNTIALL